LRSGRSPVRESLLHHAAGLHDVRLAPRVGRLRRLGGRRIGLGQRLAPGRAAAAFVVAVLVEAVVKARDTIESVLPSTTSKFCSSLSFMTM
jgi:hypothetical protein